MRHISADDVFILSSEQQASLPEHGDLWVQSNKTGPDRKQSRPVCMMG